MSCTTQSSSESEFGNICKVNFISALRYYKSFSFYKTRQIKQSGELSEYKGTYFEGSYVITWRLAIDKDATVDELILSAKYLENCKPTLVETWSKSVQSSLKGKGWFEMTMKV